MERIQELRNEGVIVGFVPTPKGGYLCELMDVEVPGVVYMEKGPTLLRALNNTLVLRAKAMTEIREEMH